MSCAQRLQIRTNCEKCTLRKSSYFCSFDSKALHELDASSQSSFYPEHATLTAEGEPARGAFILCKGRVKISSMSKDGKFVILRIAEAGEVIGLSAVITKRCHESTAETLIPTQVRFIEASTILRIIREHPDVAFHVAHSLSRECISAYNEIRSLALAPTSASKLATLLLSWSTSRAQDTNLPIHSQFTHGEIAEMIGTSRETVTRLLSKFKKKRVIEPRGSGFLVTDVRALEAMAV